MAISYTPEEIEESRVADISSKLYERASSEWNEKNPDTDNLDDDDTINAISEYFDANKDKLEKEFIREVQPGTYYCHEAIENASNVTNLVHELAEQSIIVANPEWYAMAHQAGTLLFNLYQAIGAEHLEAIPDNILELIEAQKEKNKKDETTV